MADLRFSVSGLPPAKNEAKSMLADGHSQSARVHALLEAAHTAVASGVPVPLQGRLGLEVELRTPDKQTPGDATNYLGGIGDVLEMKSRRGPLEHLGELASFGVYENDRQITEVHYRQVTAQTASYGVRIWTLGPDDTARR